ncbi:hypothetical protein C1752_03464 [Acaryochloris thomasi RCC1774]|uniref:Histidine phosphatase family protein n=1 Tax=Acaryochloris thomasi RCC1774 TaxID=1764569 RepID=A0A2W1JGE5_9CYAN|nr:histidine phosphatase family protein [Acaryochloris thomasi]PZD72628.1 hypothetical protein C1752_03464 [Acaryochloris thomasi RCC1774]
MIKKSKTVELFLALGLAVSVAACSSDVSSTGGGEAGSSETPVVAEVPEGGEGEEYSEGEQANADFEDKLSGPELLSALKEGGHVIYFRHAQTEKDYADQADPNLNLTDCETQRKLNDVGEKQAKDIGAAFKEKNIPVGEVITSEYCRAWKTADLAFGQHTKNSKLNFLPFEDYTDAQVEEMKANVTPLLTATPADGKNTILVGHDDIFEAATGIYPDPQGIAYVLTPDGSGAFELQANVLPDEWATL